VALVLFLLLLVGGCAGLGVVMTLVTTSVTKEAALVVTSRRDIWSSSWRRGVGTGRKVFWWIPLRAACSLFYIVPSLAVLIPLLDPTWRHWWWSAHGSCRTDRWRTLAIWLLTVWLLLLLWVTLVLLLWRISLLLTILALLLAVLTLRRILLMLLRWRTACRRALVVERI
jgi:hypothetical protein